jgi:hypothetical protein
LASSFRAKQTIRSNGGNPPVSGGRLSVQPLAWLDLVVERQLGRRLPGRSRLATRDLRRKRIQSHLK